MACGWICVKLTLPASSTLVTVTSTACLLVVPLEGLHRDLVDVVALALIAGVVAFVFVDRTFVVG